MDPRPFTLRKLLWMADSKRKHDFDIVIGLTCFIDQLFGGKFNPKYANPYDNQIFVSSKPGPVRDRMLDDGLKILGQGLRMMSKQR